MIIDVSDQWRIVSDEQCWAVEERRKANKAYPEGWRAIEWHSRADSALRSLSERRVRRLPGRIEDCVAEMQRILAECRAVADRVEAVKQAKTIIVDGGGKNTRYLLATHSAQSMQSEAPS